MLSKRISIQWPPELPHENTSTMVIYSKAGHFVDIRIFKDHYPIIDANSKTKFKEIFEWVMTGDEISMEPTEPDTYVLQFTHEIDSLAIMKSIDLGIPLDQCPTEPDVGTFWKTDSLDRKETGTMTNPETGKKQDYVEIWRSISAMQNTPTKEVRETNSEVDNNLFVLRVLLTNFHGQLIRSGNWAQGILHDKRNSKVPLNVIRAFYNGSEWQHMIKYGALDFPLDFNGKKNDTISVDGICWTCIE